MNFEQALSRMKQGEPMRRAEWSVNGMQAQMLVPDANSKMTYQHLYVNDDENMRVPWTPNQRDLFAEDWESAVDIIDSYDRTPDVAESFDDL